jgi:membrane protein implicated in regulation of membrane protease activity
MDTLFIIWSVLAVFLVGLELIFPGLFFFLSLALGAFSAACAALLGLDISLQALIGTLITGISFVALRYWVRSRGKDTLHKTNVYALQGKQGLVVEPISRYQRGWITLQGELWAAHAECEDTISKGETVEVISVKGAHLIVKKICLK